MNLRRVVLFLFLILGQLLFPFSSFATTNTWDFSTSGDYTFDAGKIAFSGGEASLTLQNSPSWYNQSWTKRRTVTVDNTGNSSSFTNYQVKVDVTYDADMNADFSDIRFTSSDGTTLIDFWMETSTVSTSATFWVEVPSITGSASSSIYMYYGNSGASSVSSGANTFPLMFDDFINTNTHLFPFGSDSGYSAGFDPVSRRFHFFQAVTDNLTDYNISPWANVDTWDVGFTNPPITFSNSGVVYHEADQLFYLYGGSDDRILQNKVYSFDPATGVLTQLAVTLPVSMLQPNAVYDPTTEKVYLFGGRRAISGSTKYYNGIYVHNLNLATPTLTNTGAVLPVNMGGMQPIYDPETAKIYLFGGGTDNGTGFASRTQILSYNPSSPSTNPVDTGADLSIPRDTMGSAYYDGVVYLFGGYNWNASAYTDIIEKYDIGANTVTLLPETLYHSDDDMTAFYDSETDRIYVGPVLHSTGSTNEDQRKNVILEFNPHTETLEPEPSLGSTPSGWTSTGTATIDQPRVIGGSWLSLSDHETTTFVRTNKTFSDLSDVTMLEYRVSTPNNTASNYQFYLGSSAMSGFTNAISILRNLTTTSWGLATETSTNQAIATIPSAIHLIGQLIDVPNQKQYGLVNRGSQIGPLDWFSTAGGSPINTIILATSTAGQMTTLVDWVLVRKSTTGTEPSASVGSETVFTYASDNPTITPTTGVTFTSISAFSETATKNSGEIKYQISNDGGDTWYWYSSGWTSTVSGYTEANTASEINSNISSFSAGENAFLFRAYLHSDGTQLVSLSNIQITYIYDVTPPSRSAGAPSGEQASGTTSVNMTLTTNENATCKYGTVADTAYGSIAGTFSTTGTTSHSQTISGLSDDNTYTYYVRCQDSENNANNDDYTISFSVSSTPDTTPPVRSAGTPSGEQASGTTSAEMTITTSETATCKYDTNPDTAYDAMSHTFENTNSTAHSTTISGLSDGNSYEYYVRCEDAASNENDSDYTISFSIEEEIVDDDDDEDDQQQGSIVTGSRVSIFNKTNINLNNEKQKECPVFGVSFGLVKKGSRGSEAVGVQKAINQVIGVGYVAVDGIIGPLSHAAIINVQGIVTTKIDGVWGNNTQTKYKEFLLKNGCFK